MTATSRTRIVAAASLVLARDGASHLTLESVAREAGVSKGGLLYHFPSKEALIVGMLRTLNEGFEKALQAALDQEPEGQPGRFARAYIQASMAFEEGLFSVVAGMLAAAANQPELLEPLRAAFAVWQRRLEEDGLDPVRANMIRLVVDGVWFCDLFDLASPQGAAREALTLQLMQMTRAS